MTINERERLRQFEREAQELRMENEFLKGQYTALRYSQRLAEEGVVASVGSRGDAYDNALAETFNSLYRAELIRNQGPWRGLDDVEYARRVRLVQPPTSTRLTRQE